MPGELLEGMGDFQEEDIRKGGADLQATLAEERALSSPFSPEEWRNASALRRGIQRFARLFWWWL